MIVDCHTHVEFDDDGVDESGHLSATEPVDVCIVLAGAEGSEQVDNEKLSGYVSKHKERIVGFASLNPTKEKTSVKDLTVITEKLELDGVVLYCCCDGFHPADSRAMRFYESAQELGLPVFFHNSNPLKSGSVLDYAQPYLLDEVARTFSALKIVIGSMGEPFVEQTLSMVAKHENVYADLTVKPGNVWQVYNTIVAAHECGVMEKLLFGSGFPFAKASECIEVLLGFNQLLGDTDLPAVPRGSLRNIIERNTLELFGIKNRKTGGDG